MSVGILAIHDKPTFVTHGLLASSPKRSVCNLSPLELRSLRSRLRTFAQFVRCSIFKLGKRIVICFALRLLGVSCSRL